MCIDAHGNVHFLYFFQINKSERQYSLNIETVKIFSIQGASLLFYFRSKIDASGMMLVISISNQPEMQTEAF